jgi:uncharacterized protein YfkK (UPF0435 family)
MLPISKFPGKFSMADVDDITKVYDTKYRPEFFSGNEIK